MAIVRPTLRWFGDQAMRYVRGELGKRMDRFGATAVAYARAVVPVDTGALQASIGYTYRQDTLTLTIYADKHYALFVEKGTSRMDAQPYLAPAIAHAGGRVFGTTTVTAFPNVPYTY